MELTPIAPSVLSARRRKARDHRRRMQQVRLAGRVFARRTDRLVWCGLRDAQPAQPSRRTELQQARLNMGSLRRALRRSGAERRRYHHRTAGIADRSRRHGGFAAPWRAQPLPRLSPWLPFAPGGATDVFARPVAQKLSEQLGKQFYVDNVGGASGNIGMGQAARAKPDGYSILFAFSSYVSPTRACSTRFPMIPTRTSSR